MQEHTVVPRTRIAHGAWPLSLPGVRRAVACLSGRVEGLTFKDKLCAIGICALVFSCAVLCISLLVQEVVWYAGANAASTALSSSAVMGQGFSTPATASNAAVDPTTLTLIAMPINLLIFVGLGLYLRWDSKRNP